MKLDSCVCVTCLKNYRGEARVISTLLLGEEVGNLSHSLQVGGSRPRGCYLDVPRRVPNERNLEK